MNQITILIIDDDEDLCLLLANRLGRRCQIITAHSLQAGEGIMNRIKPDLVLLDYNLPDGTGIGFLEGLRPISNVPVIMMTANEIQPIEKMMILLNISAILAKPFIIEKLEKSIAMKLDGFLR